MKRFVLAAAIAACHANPPPVTPPVTPASADIAARSHAFVDALDRADVAAVTAALAPGYLHFDGGVTDRDAELADVGRRAKARGPTDIAARTWKDDHVAVRPDSATFVGRAREHQGGNASHGGGYDFDGWYTVSWVRDGDAWQVAYVGYALAGTGGTRAMWDQIYAHGTGFEHEPNKLLVASVDALHPGTALDVAMGQGRNAVYLASRGWTVTGVDISDEGIRQAKAAAATRGLPLDAVAADLKTYDYGVAKYDLVAMIYAWPGIPRLAEIRRAVKPGGVLVYEYFARAGTNDDAPALGELARQFTSDGWTVLRDDVVEDTPDFAQDRAKIERFVARKGQ